MSGASASLEQRHHDVTGTVLNDILIGCQVSTLIYIYIYIYIYVYIYVYIYIYVHVYIYKAASKSQVLGDRQAQWRRQEFVMGGFGKIWQIFS